MALARRGTPVKNGNATAAASFAVNAPAALADGDLWFILVTHTASAGTVPRTLSMSTGGANDWAELGGPATTSFKQTIIWKRWQTGDPTSVTITFGGGTAAYSYISVAYSGQRVTGGPWGTPTNRANATSVTNTVGQLITAAENSFSLICGSLNSQSATWTALPGGGFSELDQIASGKRADILDLSTPTPGTVVSPTGTPLTYTAAATAQSNIITVELLALTTPVGRSLALPSLVAGPVGRSLSLVYVTGGEAHEFVYPDGDLDPGNWVIAPLWSKVDDPTPDGQTITATSGTETLRPYDPASPWNTVIPAGVLVDPKSTTYITAISDNGLPLTSDPDQFTIPVYYFTPATPFVTVNGSGGYHEYDVNEKSSVGHGSPWTAQIPIPAGSIAGLGSDAQMTLWDPVQGIEYGIWQLVDMGDGTYTCTNAYKTHTGTGYYGGFSDQLAGRGAGTTYFAGLVRPWEIQQGHIDHALAFAYNDPSSKYRYPAAKSDGGLNGGVTGTDAPEGLRLQLDPTLTDAQLAAYGLDAAAIVMAHALQIYGMYVIDHSGSSKVYVEYQITANWAGVVRTNSLSGLPWNKFRVVATPDDPTNPGRSDTGLRRSAADGGNNITSRGTTTAGLLTLPDGLTVGDLMVLGIYEQSELAAMAAAPSGWTPVPGFSYPRTGHGGQALWLYYRFFQAGDTAVSWTLGAATLTAWSANLFPYSSPNASNPFGAVAHVGSATNGTVVTVPPLSTTQNGSIVLNFAGLGSSSVAIVSGPTGWWRWPISPGGVKKTVGADQKFPTAGTSIGALNWLLGDPIPWDSVAIELLP